MTLIILPLFLYQNIEEFFKIMLKFIQCGPTSTFRKKKNHFALEREKVRFIYFFDTPSFYSKSAKVLKMLI